MKIRRSPQTALVMSEFLKAEREWRYGDDLSRSTGLKSGTLYPILMRLAEHRIASAGCREWAEGLAREAAFIERDWSALGWALGSTRVLLDRREAPIASLEEAYAALVKFIEFRRWQLDKGWVGSSGDLLCPKLLYLKDPAGACRIRHSYRKLSRIGSFFVP